MKAFLCYTGEELEFFDTAEEARDAALASLDSYRDMSVDGWPEEVKDIFWGSVTEHVQEVDRTGHDPECKRGDSCYEDGCYDTNGVDPQWDYTCDYQLLAIEEKR